MFARADPLTKITMEMVSHTLGSLQVGLPTCILHLLCFSLVVLVCI